MKNPLDSIGFTLTLGVALAIVIMVLPLTPGGDFSHLSLGRWGHIVAGVFWIGLLLIQHVGGAGLLPFQGRAGPIWTASGFLSIVLPALTLGSVFVGPVARMTRTSMLETLAADYVRTARAKGLPDWTVTLKHALRNAMTPVITLGALEFGTLLSGAVLTEQIFTIPGFGKLIIDSVFNRDYAVVQGVVLVTATVYILLNLLADIAYVLVNPRLRG